MNIFRKASVFSYIALLFGLFSLAPITAQTTWADNPANPTIKEYLGLFFESKMGRVESDAINSFAIVSFYPSTLENTAIVMVVQTWHDEYKITSSDLRREIREVSSALYNLFSSLIKTPFVRSRWFVSDPSQLLVIKHVRISDMSEILAVTIGPNTFFDAGKYDEAKRYVEWFGGVWSW
jgi:hypothetical protein